MGFHSPENGFCAPAPYANRVAVIGNHNMFHSLLLSSGHSITQFKEDGAPGPPSDGNNKNRIHPLLRPIIYRGRHNFNHPPYQLIITLCFSNKKRDAAISRDTEIAALSIIRLGISRILNNWFPGHSKESDGPVTAGGLRFDAGGRRRLWQHRGASDGRGRRA